MNEELLKKIFSYIEKTCVDIKIFDRYIDLFHFNFKLSDERGRNGVDLFRNLEYSTVLDIIDVKNGDRILDAGCGDSFFSLYIKSNFIVNITVLDIKLELLIQQKINCTKLDIYDSNIHFIKSDMSSLPFIKESFNKITAISSIEHIKGVGDIIAFDELSNLLAPDGILVLTLPFGQEFTETDGEPVGYEKRYDQKSIEERFPGKNDLELFSIKYFGHEKVSPFAELWYKLKLYEELGVYTPFISAGLLKLEDEPKEYSGGVILVYRKIPR